MSNEQIFYMYTFPPQFCIKVETTRCKPSIFYNSQHDQSCFTNICEKLISIPTCLGISSVCINITKHPINSCHFEFMMTAVPTEGCMVALNVQFKFICNGRSVIMRNNPLETSVYGEHSYPATVVARISSNGEWVPSGDTSGTVRIWGPGSDHTLKYEYKALAGRIDDLEWSADGQRIVVCGDSKGKSMVRAFMWDSGTNSCPEGFSEGLFRG